MVITLADLAENKPTGPVTLDALQMFLDCAMTARRHFEHAPSDHAVVERLVAFTSLFLHALRRYDWSNLDEVGHAGVAAIDADHAAWLDVGTAALASPRSMSATC